MEVPEETLDSVIEEIATILAAGYLRLLKERTLSESTPPPRRQETGEPSDAAPGVCPCSTSLTRREKGN